MSAVPLIPKMENSHNIQLLRELEMNVTAEGRVFTSRDDGYIISIPPGAVSKGSQVTLKHGVVPHEAYHIFEFPSEAYPVSAVVSVQSTSNQAFLKPITIALPHFIHCETSDDCRKLAIFKACHVTDENGVSTYQFKEMLKEQLSLFSVRNKEIGVLLHYAAYSSDHCCYWCVGTYDRNVTDKALFCLTEANLKASEGVDLSIHYCLSYYLPTCLQVNC